MKFGFCVQQNLYASHVSRNEVKTKKFTNNFLIDICTRGRPRIATARGLRENKQSSHETKLAFEADLI